MKTKTEHGDAPDLFTRNDLDLSLMNCEDLWLRLAKKKKSGYILSVSMSVEIKSIAVKH